IAEVRELTSALGGEIEQPEIPARIGRQVDQTFSAGQETIAALPEALTWQGQGGTSGRTPRSSTWPTMKTPEYTISLSSGDKTGLTASPEMRRIGAPPSAGILNNPRPCASLPPVTIHLPSGDQSAVLWPAAP